MSDPTLSALNGQGLLQIGELLLAFALSSLVGLERQLRGKPAGLRTQALVGTTSALLLLVSKYGFTDVLVTGHIVLDPSRVAAQIVSGVGFLGAGLILTRRGAVRGLTTAAAVWETAAIGMAAGAGLWLLALIVVALHFLVTYGYTALSRRVLGGQDTAVQLELAYRDGKGVLREVLASITESGWAIRQLSTGEPVDEEGTGKPLVRVTLDVSGSGDPAMLLQHMSDARGVKSVGFVAQEDLD
ncbi:MgtC/SapB family protein [Frondihabitans australicus]|uniref:Putative Mg2+ transporter-C (MgtC) family protein n=1 Tax=Frondihabitans australicus TaxID=386892 RepID=A0A495IL15_9MICO|nr:MgtC/SapB family protein [Frondihabitans australicus]RKR75971.1 putative Mg2+ transporter-C (MgtC) family protein [Frondihabitans australicus]